MENLAPPAADAANAEVVPLTPGRPTLRGHVQIMRADHWVKNVFILPGILVAIVAAGSVHWPTLAWRALVGIAAACLVASSNYVINEVLDAKYDRVHPIKKFRPVPSGAVNVSLAYVEWIGLMIAGLALAATVSLPLVLTLGMLWVMGCIYNIPPVRTKELPYLDVLSEAVNNPLRMLAGWFIVNPPGMAPASLLLSYWMVGCYFMAIKRFAEYRHIDDPTRAAAYRKSFAFYDERRLIVSIAFYGSAAMLLFGAFLMRYRLELLLSAPLVALVMAIYLDIAFKPDSAAQAPEKLHREPWLMIAVVTCAVAMAVLFFVDLPWLHELLTPTMTVPQTGVPSDLDATAGRTR